MGRQVRWGEMGKAGRSKGGIKISVVVRDKPVRGLGNDEKTVKQIDWYF